MVAIEKGAFGSPLTKVVNFTYLFIPVALPAFPITFASFDFGERSPNDIVACMLDGDIKVNEFEYQ